MWPFSRKKTEGMAGNSPSVAVALEQLASAGVGVRPGIPPDDLLYSLSGTMESPVDWVDPELYSRLQQLVSPRGAGKRFFIAGLGQDSLISFGDDQKRQTLSKLSGLKFKWE